jgi:sugar O-acyltransferase (sialic acid O-acetyltransferase NeuD family)
MKKNIILLGTGGHAHSCIDTIEDSKIFNIAGLVSKIKIDKNTVLSYPVIAVDSDLESLFGIYKNAFIGIGQMSHTDTEIRIRIFNLLKKIGFFLPKIISSKAYVSKHAFVDEGSLIMPGAIVNAGVVIGKNCIINSNSLIEHNSIIGDYCHISTGTIINGNVNIGHSTFVGSGSILREGIQVSEKSFIKMGAIVKANYA